MAASMHVSGERNSAGLVSSRRGVVIGENKKAKNEDVEKEINLGTSEENKSHIEPRRRGEIVSCVPVESQREVEVAGKSLQGWP